MKTDKILDLLKNYSEDSNYRTLNWRGTFTDYLDMVTNNPKIARSAFQRIYDMIVEAGHEEYTEYRKKIKHYKFFQDQHNNGKDAIFGMDIALMKLVNIFKAAAQNYGPEKRVILLHGPVGSSKSTIARLLKKGLEVYSRTDNGALYTYKWTGLKDIMQMEDEFMSPMHEDPLLLIPKDMREKVLSVINKGHKDTFKITLGGDLCPPCRYIFNKLMEHYEGDWHKVVKHVEVSRLIISEQDRIGIGTFQPKDEKNQDSTELSGDVNYRKIALYGSDSDPRAFNFDGEFNVANRGIIEFVEVLKLDVAFLYDLLGASQEHMIKPKKFAQTYIDELILGHTNEPEFRKLQNNEFMEALRDRTVKVDVPYITKISEEIKVYQKDFNDTTVKDIHIAPHTIEMAATWAVLTRLEDPKKPNLSLTQKAKLYDGKTLPGFTEDNIKELRKETKREGLEGISPRFIQDRISNVLVENKGDGCINPFMVMNEILGGIKTHSLIASEDTRTRYHEILDSVKKEFEDVAKNEVQRAITADDEVISKLCANYIDNVKAHTQKERVKNKYTGQDEEPDERLMRSIEEKIDIPDNRKDDFRREVMNYIGALAIEGKVFDFRTNERLHKALELKLFEDQKDSIKLTTIVSNVVDKESQAKIDVVKERLIKNYGYCDICATDILNYVASIFARGDIKKNA